jgi:hypothetical protein
MGFTHPPLGREYQALSRNDLPQAANKIVATNDFRDRKLAARVGFHTASFLSV